MNSPFLLIGYERSGTTFLRRIMSMHPGLDAHIVHEKRKLFNSIKSRSDALHRMHWHQRPDGRNNDESIRSGLKMPYVSFQQGKSCVEKMMFLFPETSIVHIIRNPIGSVNSQVRTFKKNANKSIDNYFASVPKVTKYLKRYPSVLTVKYEDVLADPFLETRKLYSYMGGESSDDHISKAISTKEAWFCGNRVMCGLRYFDSIRNTQPSMMLAQKHINRINELSIEHGI